MIRRCTKALIFFVASAARASPQMKSRIRDGALRHMRRQSRIAQSPADRPLVGVKQFKLRSISAACTSLPPRAGKNTACGNRPAPDIAQA